MMFQKQTIALVLSCIAASTSAFSTAGFGGRAVQNVAVAPSTFMTENANKLRNIAFTTLSESTEEESAVVEESAAVAEPEAVAEPAAEPAVEKPEEDINCVAYVVNLSYDTQFSKIREMFEQFGSVEKVFVPKNRDTGKSKGIAFVTMGTEAERDAAIETLNASDIDGRTVYVDKAKPRGQATEKNADMTKIYIGNISYDTTGDDLYNLFSEYGPVENIYVPTDRYTGSPRGFAFLAMNPPDAEKVIADFDGTDLGGRTIEVKVSLPRGAKAPNRKNETKLYVGNISFNTAEETLREVFEEYGPIIDMYIPTDQETGRPRGFAFITVEPDNAIRAIEECDGFELDGRMLRVNEAQAKGAGGGGGGGYARNDPPTNDW